MAVVWKLTDTPGWETTDAVKVFSLFSVILCVWEEKQKLFVSVVHSEFLANMLMLLTALCSFVFSFLMFSVFSLCCCSVGVLGHPAAPSCSLCFTPSGSNANVPTGRPLWSVWINGRKEEWLFVMVCSVVQTSALGWVYFLFTSCFPSLLMVD